MQEAVKGVKHAAVPGVFAGVLSMLYTVLLGHHRMRAWVQAALAQHTASLPGPQVPAHPHASSKHSFVIVQHCISVLYSRSVPFWSQIQHMPAVWQLSCPLAIECLACIPDLVPGQDTAPAAEAQADAGMCKANGHASLPAAAEQPEDTIKAVGGLVTVTSVGSPAQQVQISSGGRGT